MLSLTVCFLVTVTVMIFFNGAEGDDVGRGSATTDRLKSISEKIYFPSDLPHHHQHYGQPCSTCNYHNHEGYPPPNPHKYDVLPPPNTNEHNHLPPPNPFKANGRYPPPNFQHTYQFHRDHDFPPGFKHNPEFHERNFGGRDEKHFGVGPDTVEFKNISMNEIPLEFYETLDKTDVEDILNNYVEGFKEEKAKSAIGNRFGDESQERNAGMIPAKAECRPENVSVSLANSDDPTVIFIPKCTRIERCGGCCSNKLLACQPTETATISVQVIKTQYTGTGAKKLKYLGKEIIPLEKHLKCKCSCKIRAEHCLPNQQYRSSQCRCVCANKDEEQKCSRDPDRKYWDFQACTCKCRYVMECSTGSFYDHNECRCKNTPKRRYAKYDRRLVVVREDEYLTPVELYDLK